MCNYQKKRLKEYEENVKQVLYNDRLNVKDEEYSKFILEQYKGYVEVVDQVGRRRDANNKLLIVINSALITALFTLKLTIQPWILALMGGLICLYWLYMLRNYGRLTEVKFFIIKKIEKEFLPLSLFDAEWKALKKGKHFFHYLRLPCMEKFIPIIFIIVYFCIGFGFLPMANNVISSRSPDFDISVAIQIQNLKLF